MKEQEQFVLVDVIHTQAGVTVRFDVIRGSGRYQAVATKPTFEEAVQAATKGAPYADARPAESPAARAQRRIDSIAYQG